MANVAPETFALAFFTQLGADLESAEPPKDPGLVQISLWRQVGGEDGAVGILHFPDEATANATLKRLVEENDHGVDDGLPLPSESVHVQVGARKGQTPENTPVGSYVVIARISASPGYGEEIAESIGAFVEGLAQLDGFLGFVNGANVSLSEELWSLTLWAAPPDLQVPDDVEAQVRFFRRIK